MEVDYSKLTSKHFSPDRGRPNSTKHWRSGEKIIYETDDFAVTKWNTYACYLWRNHEEQAMCFNPIKSHGTYENWYRKVRKRVEKRIEKIAVQLGDLIDERNKLQTWLDG